MGLSDRDYARSGPRLYQTSSGLGAMRLWSANTWIIIVNVAVFVIDNMLASSGVTVNSVVRVEQVRSAIDGSISLRKIAVPMPPLEAYFHFSTAQGFFGLEFWRFIGFQFLHANVSHIFFNMLGLYFFGALVEQYLGAKRYVAFYLTCGVFGAVSYLLLNLLGNVIPVHVPGLLINDIYTPLIGASAGVFGVLIACAYVSPNSIVLLFFVIPMKLWQVAYGFVILAAINLIMSGHNAGGDAAHMGGAIAGFYFIRHTHHLRDFFDIFAPRKPRIKKSVKKRRSKAGPSFPGRRTPDDTEIDRILAKIATHGLHSLSEKEKKTLRQATDSKKR